MLPNRWNGTTPLGVDVPFPPEALRRAHEASCKLLPGTSAGSVLYVPSTNTANKLTGQERGVAHFGTLSLAVALVR